MKVAPIPAYERERLKALNDYYILDTLPEGDFDDITDIASMVCDTPVALVSFIDANRQWFKSHHGLMTTETSRDHAFCAHAINTPDEPFIVNDLSKDERFHDNPFVTGDNKALFYAGIPLVNPEGYVLGTLCVLDNKPRTLNADQVKTLRSLGHQVIAQLELRKKSRLLKQKQAELRMAYADLESIAYIASHDLKSPLNNIISLASLLRDEYAEKLEAEGKEYVGFLNDSAYHLSDMISGILNYSRASRLPVEEKEKINIAALIEEILPSLQVPGNIAIAYDNDIKEIYTSRPALKQVLQNLLQNAIGYIDKPDGKVSVSIREDKNAYIFEVKDNGEGIADEDKEKMYALFTRLKGREKNTANLGLGLTIARRLVEKLGGILTLSSEEGKGSAFVFTIPK